MRRGLLISAAAALVIACASPVPSPGHSHNASPDPNPLSTASQIGSPLPSTVPGSKTPTPPFASSSTPTAGVPAFIRYASGFSDLTFVTNAGDGSGDLYAVAQAGQIFVVTQGQSAPSAPWLDISERVGSGGERGLLGLAFHPEFAANGRLFVNYTDLNGNTVISEFLRGADGTVDPTSERVIKHVDQPYANHNGGMLAFGPDGYLYVGLGDGGGAGDPQGSGQSLSTYLGKILRIDVDAQAPALYGIPPDNPFAGGADTGPMPEIWDWGLRNPWRFSFDSKSGGLFIGDVGQGQTEEIDVEPAGLGGLNYGWNIMEGDHCFNTPSCDQTGLTLPVATYSHAEGCGVAGGYVYRGARVPELDGRYFYADVCSGTIWTLEADATLAGEPVTSEVFGAAGFAVSSFGEDEAGELYIVDHKGAIWTLTSAAP